MPAQPAEALGGLPCHGNAPRAQGQRSTAHLQVFVDTAGYAFTFPLAMAAGARVACYVHYPTISTDMLRRVQSRQVPADHIPSCPQPCPRGCLTNDVLKHFAPHVVCLLP